jgi:hypothetical protein
MYCTVLLPYIRGSSRTHLTTPTGDYVQRVDTVFSWSRWSQDGIDGSSLSPLQKGTGLPFADKRYCIAAVIYVWS